MNFYPTLLEFSLGRKKDTTLSWLMNCITQKPYQIFFALHLIFLNIQRKLSLQQRKRIIKQNTFVLQCCTSASSQTAKIGPLRLPALQPLPCLALSQMFLGCRTT